MSLKYAYCRISTTDQNIDRQIIAVKQFAPDISDNNIFVDKKTGKDFEREQYQEMKVILEHISKASLKNEPIELIVEELDRLGRNADLIKKELMWFKEHNIIVRILEIPTTLHEVDESNRWVTEMVTNLLIEVYAQLAQVELEKRAKRQAEGIAVAKANGVYKGRKPIQIDNEQFVVIYTRWKSNEITARQAMAELNIKSNTFYRRVKEYETNKKASSNT
jgi:DNA invertase Pin-like site-specific DNA recombinase